jgi:hypothetical protein
VATTLIIVVRVDVVFEDAAKAIYNFISSITPRIMLAFHARHPLFFDAASVMLPEKKLLLNTGAMWICAGFYSANVGYIGGDAHALLLPNELQWAIARAQHFIIRT